MANNAANDIAKILQSAENFMKKVEAGEGLNIPEDKKEEFKAQMQSQGANKLMDELKTKMQEFKDISKKMNHATNKTN